MRKCLDFLKAAGRRTIPTEGSYFSQIPDESATPETQYLIVDSEDHVRQLCQMLKSPYREVASAHFCDGLTITEIAQKQNKNTKTIQTQLYRSKAMLKKMLNDEKSARRASASTYAANQKRGRGD